MCPKTCESQDVGGIRLYSLRATHSLQGHENWQERYEMIQLKHPDMLQHL
jgi:hypothetical protein